MPKEKRPRRTMDEELSRMLDDDADADRTSGHDQDEEEEEEEEGEEEEEEQSYHGRGGGRGGKGGSSRRRRTDRDETTEVIEVDDDDEDDDQQERSGDEEEDDETAARIPDDLLTRILHEFFAREDTRISKGANRALAKYFDTFVAEAVARTAAERPDSSFLEVEDLEKITPQLLMDL